jgi:Arylsulfotransferase (ASST)
MKVSPRLTVRVLCLAVVVAAAGAALGTSVAGAVTTGPVVAVYPSPGDRYETPETQIAFRGVSVSKIGAIKVVGSETGVHAGRIVADSDGDGGSFIPVKPFHGRETVTVSTHLRIAGAPSGTFHFGIEQPRRPLTAAPLPLVRSAAVQHFRANPGLNPASVTVTENRAPASDGDIFVTPQFGPLQNGPMILNQNGRLVWFRPMPSKEMLAADLRVQRLHGRPVLTWWQGTMKAGSGRGVGVILDQRYQQVATVRAANGLQMDLHEFLVTNQGDAWILAVSPMHLPGVGRTVENGVVQEIDIKTGLVLFQWDSMDHVLPRYSYLWGPKTPGHILDPWHLNSISLDGSDPVISMRNMSAVVKLDHLTGTVDWTLGGKHSSFAMGAGTSSVFQHDALFHGSNQLTIFDNGGAPPRAHTYSRGVRVAINAKTHSVRLIGEYRHAPQLAANFEGNVQPLSHGDVFLGWGQQPDFSQDTAAGAQVFSAHFPSGTSTYRAYRFGWRAQPATAPAVAVARGPGDLLTLFASWNGATDVAAWRVLTGGSPSALQGREHRARTGFQTVLRIHTRHRYVAVQALGRSGKVLATSAIKQLG